MADVSYPIISPDLNREIVEKMSYYYQFKNCLFLINVPLKVFYLHKIVVDL